LFYDLLKSLVFLLNLIQIRVQELLPEMQRRGGKEATTTAAK